MLKTPVGTAGVVGDKWKTIGRDLGGNWDQIWETDSSWQTTFGRQAEDNWTTNGDIWETTGRQGGRQSGRQGAGHTMGVGDKVPRFPEPCAYMGVH